MSDMKNPPSHPVPHTARISTSHSTTLTIGIYPGDCVLIAGPNGVGKSALLAEIYRQFHVESATYLPGHRQIHFNNAWDTIGNSLEQIRMNLFSHPSHFSRHKNSWSEDHFKSTIRRLQNAENVYNQDIRDRVEAKEFHPKPSEDGKNSPLQILNAIFESARLPPRFKVHKEFGLAASREGATYPIDALSDGERASLFIAATVITQEPNTVILIDEPEKHLHPSIAGRLFEAALRANQHIAVVVSSHDVHLIDNLSVSRVFHLRNSRVVRENPEARHYDIEEVDVTDAVIDDLKRDLLGSRSDVLFIEGALEGSDDIAVYSHVYSSLKIIPKGGHGEVTNAVVSLRALPSAHWMTPFGLIDKDWRDDEEVKSLHKKGVHVLPVPTVENLFFLEEAMDLFKEASQNFGRAGAAKSDADLLSVVREAAEGSLKEIILRRMAWRIERELSSLKICAKDLSGGYPMSGEIPYGDIYHQSAYEVESALRLERASEILTSLPIKKTKIPHGVASALGASTFDEYKRVIITQLDRKTIASQAYLKALRRLLPEIQAN